jgi:CheY-like chemotaxis protein
MSDIRQRLSDFVRDNPDAVVVAFAVIFLVMITLAVLNFLWARRDAVWREQLTEARLAARGFIHPTASPLTADPDDPALVERNGRTVYSVAGRQGESDPAAPPIQPEPARQPAAQAPAHWQTQIAPRPATAAAWALGEPEVTEPAAPAPIAPIAWPEAEATANQAAEPAPAPIAAPPVTSPAVWSHPPLTPEPPTALFAGEAPTPPPPISEPVAVEQYEVWQSVTSADEEALPATDGAGGGAAAASAYAAWDQVTTAPESGAPATPPPPCDPAAAAPPVPEAVSDGGDGPDILLVEDDQNVGKVYRLLMESKGFAVRHAVDGVAGLELARARRPDLILLDVMMPRMNGILFLQSLRAEQRLRDVPVVILSNFREPRLVERALALGAIEYIVKAQTRPDAMLAAIPRWLKGERALST